MRQLLRVAVAAMFIVPATQVQAAWFEAKSRHFIIYADESPRQLQGYAEHLERFDQAVRYLFGMDDPALTDSERINIFVLPSEDSVSKLIGARWAAGMYEGSPSGSYAFVPRIPAEVGVDYSQVIFFHEYAHYLQLQSTDYFVPAWYREGFADFLSSADLKKDGSVVFGQVPPGREWTSLQTTEMPLPVMLGETYGKLNQERIDDLYSRGWLLTDYLTVEPSRKGQLDSYLNAISKGIRPIDAAQSAFGDLKQLERDVDRYAGGMLRGYTVAASKISVGPVALRALGAGEAAIMDVRIHSKRGVDSKAAPIVAAEAEKVAESYPNDAFVQGCLAEAEFDAKNYSASEAAAGRALALDPANVHALIYKGNAEMAMGAKNPKTADWDSIRQWFIKANKLDTENAEPLALNYDTYKAAQEQPTPNAVQGLLYALQLAPRDEELRMEAVTELLKEGRTTEAKNAFASIAYEPHASDQARDWSDKIMTAISQGDSKAALEFIEAASQAAVAQEKKAAP